MLFAYLPVNQEEIIKFERHKKIVIIFVSIVLFFLECGISQSITNPYIEHLKKTVVFIGTLEEKEIVEKPNDGKCEVIHRSEPHFLATGFLVQISSPQFSQDEFNDR